MSLQLERRILNAKGIYFPTAVHRRSKGVIFLMVKVHKLFCCETLGKLLIIF